MLVFSGRHNCSFTLNSLDYYTGPIFAKIAEWADV
jgi:hypothetical protein